MNKQCGKQYGKGLVETLLDDLRLIILHAAGYKSKPSSHTIRESLERDRVLQARLRAEGNKSELMCIAYGGKPATDDGKLLVAGWKADIQRAQQAHTSAGDFSHLAGNPLILK